MSEQDFSHDTERLAERPSLAEIKEHAKNLLESFLHGPSGEESTTLRVGRMFGMDAESSHTITKEELEPITSFAKSATKEIAEGAAESPLSRKQVASGRIHDALASLAPAGAINHDVLHAGWAHYRTEGRSLKPAYLGVENKEMQFTDPTAVQEELVVGLFDDNVFIRGLIASKSKKETVRVHFAERTSKNVESLKRLENMLVAISETGESEEQYCLSLYETYLAALDSGTVPEYADAVKKIGEKRDPTYIELFSKIYTNEKSTNPDKKLMLREFQKLIAPPSKPLHQAKKAA